MSKRQLLCLLGIWIMIFLFLGFPSLWHKIIAVVSGLLVIALAYSFPAPTNPTPKTPVAPPEAFVENKQS